MNDHELGRRLEHWLADGPHEAPAAVVERALAEARALPQGRVIGLPWHDLPAFPFPAWRAVATALSLAILLVAAASLWTIYNQTAPPAASPSPTALIASPSPGTTPSPTAPSPSPSPAASPSSPPSPTLLPPPEPGETPAVVSTIEGDVNYMMGTESGYVAWGFVEDAEHTGWSTAWFSPDGREWQQFRLANSLTCPGGVPTERPDTEAWGGATDGRRVVLVGWHIDYGTSCETRQQRAIAWFSPDGRTWTRSTPFGEVSDYYASLEHAWWVDGSWEALTGSAPAPEPIDLWRSGDGLAWVHAATVPTEAGPDRSQPRRVAAALDGRRLIALDGANLTTRLLTSTDGVAWQPVDSFSPGPRGEGVELLLAPTPDGADRWLIIHGSTDGLSAWVSQDLVEWQQARSPVNALTAGAWTRHGYVVAGLGAGRLERRRVEIARSDDGISWLPVTPPHDQSRRIMALADGPAGVLAVTGRLNASDVTYVYRLPVTP